MMRIRRKVKITFDGNGRIWAILFGGDSALIVFGADYGVVLRSQRQAEMLARLYFQCEWCEGIKPCRF